MESPLSPHLRSRMKVAQELAGGSVPTTLLRSAIIIGSGSASYEIIKHLVLNLPVLLAPSWAGTRCQPIAVRNVVKYLVGVLEIPATAGKSYDIGGKDVLTYEEMLKVLAELLGKRRIFIPCPFCNNIPLFAYLASLVTPVPAQMTWCLMEGILNEVICQRADIKEVLPFQPLGYREALVRAMSREEQDKVRPRDGPTPIRRRTSWPCNSARSRRPSASRRPTRCLPRKALLRFFVPSAISGATRAGSTPTSSGGSEGPLTGF